MVYFDPIKHHCPENDQQDTNYSTFTTSCVHYGQLILSCNELCGFGLLLNDFDQYEYLHLLLKKFLVHYINQLM